MASSVVLITGALTGIGRATAFAFARIGAQLVVSGRHDETGRSLAGELREAGAEAEFVRADVRVEDDVRVLVDRAVARFGRLDIAVNNAARFCSAALLDMRLAGDLPGGEPRISSTTRVTTAMKRSYSFRTLPSNLISSLVTNCGRSFSAAHRPLSGRVRMAAGRERSIRYRAGGPASESLRRTNPREGGERLAVYGDLSE
jgi:enoyl-[acyl-carrier-protein] reductase (NADH)